METTKQVIGQLLDMHMIQVVAEARITIQRISTTDRTNMCHYEITTTVEGYHPELSDTSYILKLNETTLGQVFLIILGRPKAIETQFTVLLEGITWSVNPEWFQLL